MENNKPDVFPNGDNDDRQKKLDDMNKLMRERREEEARMRGGDLPPQQKRDDAITRQLKPEPKKSLVEPDWDSDFDVLSLPSKGLLYHPKKERLKVSYMNAGDENILTNPNLLRSGRFLEVLISRKILDSDLKYRDLLVGDRDAIMIWLRSTGYGNMYPISLIDPETGEEFQTEIDLSEMKTIPMGAEPDDEGLFDFELPTTKKKVKFRLMTVGDSEDLERYSEMSEDATDSELATLTLRKHIVEIDGNRDSEYLDNAIPKIRVLDSRKLKKYISEIEPKIDLNLSVEAPGGGRVETFFPLNPAFFWPEL